MFDTMEQPLDSRGETDIAWALTADAMEDLERDFHDPRLPEGLGELAPGPVLAAVLAEIDVDSVDGHDRVVILQAHARMAAHYEAQMYRSMASVGEFSSHLYEHNGTATDSATAEVELALTLTRRAAEHELAFARQLRAELPGVWERFSAGAIDRRKARTIANGVAHLDTEIARAIVERILDDATELTTGQIAARLRRLCLESDPEDTKRRYDEALSDRRVTVEQTPSGTASLYACDLPADRLAAIRRRIHQIALELKTGGERRTMDQLRADVLLDLLEGTGLHCGHDRGVVDIHVDLATLTGLRHTPGEIPGFGPVAADIARQLVAGSFDAEWRWTVTDDNGAVVANGITRRRPTRAMRRFVEARRRVCAFPGCRMPASRSDLDHTVPWADSKRTKPRHLVPLCRHHHVIRHLPGWSYRIGDDGTVIWSTPLRHVYARRGPPNL